MNVELLTITTNPLEFIGDCAGICYNAKRDPESNRRRAIGCKDKGHLSTLRFAHATFHVSGISRICSHQFVRSKHLDFLQRSQRYCKELDQSFTSPDCDAADYDKIKQHYEASLKLYSELLQYGMKKEDARFVLPEATQTELIVTGNLQAWLDFVRLRADKHAQWEIRAVAVAINNELAKHCPGLFEEIVV